MEELEAALTLDLIYPEFQSAILAFAAAYAESPWAPPPPAAAAADGEEAEGEAEGLTSKEAAAEGGGEEDAEAAAAAAPPAPVGTVPTLVEVVMPTIGKHLLAALSDKASVAD